MMGSVAQKVARHSPIPVLIVREDGQIPSGPYPDPTRPLRPVKALVALDGSKRAETTLVPTVHLLEALTAPAQGLLHLIQVIPLPSAGYGEYDSYRVSSFTYTEEVDEAESYLSSLITHLKKTLAPNLKPALTWSVIGASDVAESLIDVAEEGEKPASGGYDLIAIATHGRSGLARWALGSVTERILGATKLPLFIVRSSDLENG
jgi:nucleotide-binding universal stress UspA family protein